MLGWIVGILIWAIVWGVATKIVIENKGYDDNWFIWGFLFGFIAFLVAIAKPENHSRNNYDNNSDDSYLSSIAREKDNKTMISNGGWKCQCGRVNPSYTGTCGCGRTKDAIQALEKQKVEAERKKAEDEEQQKKLEAENLKLDNLKKLKELLDAGVITQEEFDKKKKEALGL